MPFTSIYKSGRCNSVRYASCQGECACSAVPRHAVVLCILAQEQAGGKARPSQLYKRLSVQALAPTSTSIGPSVAKAPLLDLLLALAHTGLLALQLTVAIQATHLPDSLTGMHAIYQNIDTAKARILLPKKAAAFTAVTTNVGSLGTGDVPVCGTDAQMVQKVTQMPLWELQDDESGLQDLTHQLVCSDRLPSQSICCTGHASPAHIACDATQL
jgi:hypothetical protein